MRFIAYLRPSASGKESKYTVTVFYHKGSKIAHKTIHFGMRGYSDFTQHRDPLRMKKYQSRHRSRENWNITGVLTAGFWSRWILWSEPSLLDAIEAITTKFKIQVIRGQPPFKQS